nr:MAG TPA: hypothetical protein [Caudoviricetes sp.]
MSKSCLVKLSDNILVACDLPLYGIPEIYLMHIEDVTFSYNGTATQILTATFADGAKSYKVEGYKRNLQVTSAFRSTDASGRFDVSVMFKSKLTGAVARPIMNGRFYVMVVDPQDSGINTVWGCNAPLECSNIEYDSNANGKLVTYTLSAPEGSAGNIRVVTSAAVAAKIISKSV